MTLPCIIMCTSCEAEGCTTGPPLLAATHAENTRQASECQPVYAFSSPAAVSAGDRMGEVYINEDQEPFVLEEDGRLDLSGLGLTYSSISLQGKKGLVDTGTGKTKRAWEKLLRDIFTSDDGAQLGTMQKPLQVKGVQKVGSGGYYFYGAFARRSVCCINPSALV